MIEEYGLPCPNYIKIDVPALTDTIVESAMKTAVRGLSQGSCGALVGEELFRASCRRQGMPRYRISAVSSSV